MSLAKKVGKAGLLLVLRRVWGAVVTFAVMAYLARELTTEDFGVLAISTILIEFTSTLAISGISEYAIFYNGKDKADVFNAIFWFSLMAALLVASVVLILTPFWTGFYGKEEIEFIVYLLLFGFVFQVLSAVPSTLFRKEINFQPLITTTMISNTLVNLSKVGLAYAGYGVYSLALPTAVFAPMTALALYWQSDFLPKLSLGLKYWKPIIQYTKFVIGQRVLIKLVNQGDQLILGTFWGVDLLGIYAIAWQFANYVPSYLIPVIQDISSPILAKDNNDLEMVRIRFYKILRTISFICIPLLTFVILNANFLIINIYGAKWSDAVLPCQLIAAYLIVRSVSSPTSSLYNVLGKPNVGFYFTLSYVPIFLVTLFLASYYTDFITTVIVICIIKGLGSFAHFFIVPRLTQASVWSFLKVVVPITGASLLGYLASSLLILDSSLNHFVIETLLYFTVTMLSLRLFWKDSLFKFINHTKSMIPQPIAKLIWK